MTIQNRIIYFLIVGLFVGCNSSSIDDKSNSESNIEWKTQYELINEKIIDDKIKAQIVLKIKIDPKLNDDDLKKLLVNIYNETRNRTGFKHFDNPTNIFIYAFNSDKMHNLSTEWRAMVAKSFSQSKPDYTIKDQKIHVEKSVGHIDLKTKKEIYYKSYEAEIKSQVDAYIKFPNSKDFKKQTDYMYELDDQYQAAIRKEYNITDDEMAGITIEGITNDWPYPRH